MNADILAIIAQYSDYNTVYRLGIMPILLGIAIVKHDIYTLLRNRYIYSNVLIDDGADIDYSRCIYKNKIDDAIYHISINKNKYFDATLSYKFAGFKLYSIECFRSHNLYNIIQLTHDNISINYNIYKYTIELEYIARHGDIKYTYNRYYKRNTIVYNLLHEIRDKLYKRFIA
jgi:hypothetical protein